MASFPLVAAVAIAVLHLLSLPSASSVDDPLALLLDRQASQLNRLETLIESLAASVSALQSSLSHCAAAPPPPLAAISAAANPIIDPSQWSERFQLSASAAIDADPSIAAFLPYEDPAGLAKFFALGDALGRVRILASASGDLLVELPALAKSPITSILTFIKDTTEESLLFAGHTDGSITSHHLAASLLVISSQLFVHGGGSAVTDLETHQVGRTRYVIASDLTGRIRVFTENGGTLYGTAIASARPLAFVKQKLVFLTETGAGSLDLRSMAVKETECEGFNGSMVVKSYSFDGSERTKAYGFTAGGDLVHVILLGDAANLKCRIRSIRKSEIENPVSIQAIKGYLVVAGREKVFVYNISSQYYGRVGVPRPLFSSTFQEIKKSLLNQEGNEISNEGHLIATDREKLLVLGLGGGYVGVYRSNFPVFKVESNAVVWSAPALFFLLFLIGIWQFYVKKKDALGWTPEESFDVSVAPPGGDRGYSDASRSAVAASADMRERRGNALRGGPTQRYVSPPSRYPSGPSIPFRPTSADPGFRGGAVGLQRREQLFQNNPKVVDDHND